MKNYCQELNILRVSFFLCCLLFSGLGVTAQETNSEKNDSARELRILSYNIHHGEGVDKKLDLARIAKVIVSAKPDLVALQEIDVLTSRTGQVDQAKQLAKLTKMNYVFGGNIKFGGGDYGNAVLSRFPIQKSQNLKLPNHRQGEQRGLLQVELRTDLLKQPIQFWCTHFDHRPQDSERFASAVLVNKELAKVNGALCFFAGDLNDTIGSRSLLALEKSWVRSNSTPLPTVPVKSPARQIDFIYASRNSRAECIQTKVLPEAIASDHRAVLAIYLVK